MGNIMSKLDLVQELTKNCYIRKADLRDYVEISEALRERLLDTRQEMVDNMLSQLQALEDSL
jgi:hypothetical protein